MESDCRCCTVRTYTRAAFPACSLAGYVYDEVRQHYITSTVRMRIYAVHGESMTFRVVVYLTLAFRSSIRANTYVRDS